MIARSAANRTRRLGCASAAASGDGCPAPVYNTPESLPPSQLVGRGDRGVGIICRKRIGEHVVQEIGFRRPPAIPRVAPMRPAASRPNTQRLALIVAIIGPQLRERAGQPGHPDDSCFVGRIAGRAESLRRIVPVPELDLVRLIGGERRRAGGIAGDRVGERLLRRKSGSSSAAAERLGHCEAAAAVRIHFGTQRWIARGEHRQEWPIDERRICGGCGASAARRPGSASRASASSVAVTPGLPDGGQIVASNRAHFGRWVGQLGDELGDSLRIVRHGRGRRHAGIGELRHRPAPAPWCGPAAACRCEPNCATSSARWASVSCSWASSSRIGLARSGRPSSMSQTIAWK